jgi:hypothetical protein
VVPLLDSWIPQRPFRLRFDPAGLLAMHHRHDLPRSAVGLVIACLAAAAGAAPSPDAAAGDFRPLLYAAEGAKKIVEYAKDGTVAWECPAEMSRDAWKLPNGNVLFCYNDGYNSGKNDNPGGVREVDRERKVVFEFKTTGQVWSCQRLADGNTLVGAASQGKLLIVSPKGEVVRSIPLKNAPGHSCIRNARQIANGNILVAEESAKAVREYAPDGALVREIRVNFAPYSAVRLPDGNTLACGQQAMVEIDPAGKETWSLKGADLPALGVRWFAGIQVLPGGSVFVCNAGGKVPFFEVNRDRQVVWQCDPATTPIPMGHGVQRLDVPGAPLR